MPRLRSSPSSPWSAPNATSTWPAVFRSPSVRAMSTVGASSSVQVPSSFGPLALDRLERPVVGDGGCEQGDVEVCERECGVEHRLGRRCRQHLDAVRRRHLRLAASSTTSAPRRRASSASATPMRPDERLPTKRTLSIGSRVPPAVTITRRPASEPGREQLLDAGGDLLGLGKPADAPLALGELAFVGPDQLDAPRERAARRSRGSRRATTCAGSSPERRASARDARARPR